MDCLFCLSNFSGITDIKSIFEEVKDFCDLFWLENLNLRGSFRATIMDYIKEKHTDLLPLCQGIYQFKDKSYWKMFERESAAMAKINGCQYVDNELPYGRSPKGYPALLTTSYHEEIRGSENTGKRQIK